VRFSSKEEADAAKEKMDSTEYVTQVVLDAQD
jgi:hypothetical protein